MTGFDDTLRAARFMPGQVLAARYRIIERIGKGGMGEVFRADDLKLGQQVALKFLTVDPKDNPEHLRELFAEVRMARQVSHPNVCRVHDIEELDGTHALSMEFVDGENLASLMRRIGRLPVDKACQIAHEICAGMAAIHERGVLHRDLKPANIMLDGRGHARITDFGLAIVQGRESEPDAIAGTPAYMAPESFLGVGATSARSDLYSLGLVLYELFTGRMAFESTSIQALIQARHEGKFVSPTKVVRDLDPRIERAIVRCLEPTPARRPASASEVSSTLPGGDRLAAAMAAGETPSPELVAAATGRAEGLRPEVAWSCLAVLAIGLVALTAIAPSTRLVARVPITEAPEAMAGQASDLLRDLGVPGPPGDRVFGLDHDEAVVDRVVTTDHSRSRWENPSAVHGVTFWYRESRGEIVPAGPSFRVRYGEPPMSTVMSGVKLDVRGHLLRLDVSPTAAAAQTASEPWLDALFDAAGLDRATATPVDPAGLPPAAGDQWLAFTAARRNEPQRQAWVDVVALRGRPVSFRVREPAEVQSREVPDPSRLATRFILKSLRPALAFASLLAGVWLARRNLRGRRADPKRALRLAFTMLAIAMLGWALGAHHTIGSITRQLTTALTWSLYDFAFGWIFYTAIEPYVRRLWPRLLTSWVRVLDGQFADARVGRDLLLGSLAGLAIALLVAAHQAAPALFGAAPGRPDNVGYIENQLASLLGPRAQLAEIVDLIRSNLELGMGFMVILVLARLILRHPAAAILATFAIFVPLGLPRGEFVALNLALAVAASTILLLVLVRVGLLAAMVALVVHAWLEAAPLGLGLGTWATDATVLPLVLVFGLGCYGFVRSLGGRSAFHDPLPAG